MQKADPHGTFRGSSIHTSTLTLPDIDTMPLCGAEHSQVGTSICRRGRCIWYSCLGRASDNWQSDKVCVRDYSCQLMSEFPMVILESKLLSAAVVAVAVAVVGSRCKVTGAALTIQYIFLRRHVCSLNIQYIQSAALSSHTFSHRILCASERYIRVNRKMVSDLRSFPPLCSALLCAFLLFLSLPLTLTFPFPLLPSISRSLCFSLFLSLSFFSLSGLRVRDQKL